MNKNKLPLKIIIVILIIIALSLIISNINKSSAFNNSYKIDLTTLTYGKNKKINNIPIYSDFSKFLKDYNKNKLPDVYLTEFLFDGVGMYKVYNQDNFMQNSNNIEEKDLKILSLNINTNGNIELTGKLVGGMIAVNTNNIKGNININLNGINIDTVSKDIPAIYIYNKDKNYTDSKVTINSIKNTNNYLNGGSLKKVNLSENSNYISEEIKNILFARVISNNEDINNTTPYYFYEASGVVSSDIDLTFEGKGYIEIISKDKRGIETKGDLVFKGGTGNYLINAKTDCLKATNNTLKIDVNSLYAIVSNKTDGGNAISSSGEIIINNGIIVALSGLNNGISLNSELGTYINGGTIIGIGLIQKEIKSNSKQAFITLRFNESVNEDELITLLDKSDNPVFSYRTDRLYTSLVYSSNNLSKGIYSLYKEGTIDGQSSYGLYTKISSYLKGDQLAHNNLMTNTSNNTSIDINKTITAKNKDFIIDKTANSFNGLALYKNR